MLATFGQYIVLIVVIMLLVMLANKLKVAYPVMLVLGGLLLSFQTWIPSVKIDPELIFIIFLPPLLYEAAWYTSWKELWRWRRVISSFAFLIVLVTALVVAIFSSWLIPGFSLALGFLLGGIISPPDAVSASAVLRFVKVPKRLSAIVEGESLLNDAGSLIIFRFSLIAVETGRFVFHEAALSFVSVIVMGIATGLVIGYIFYIALLKLPTTPQMDIVLSIAAPYVMYIVAESMHFSGVLAVVAGGLYLSARSHRYLSYRSRFQGTTVWSVLGFVLNGLIFMLIGLELPEIIRQLGEVSMGEAIKYGLLITGILIVSRIVCTLFASVFTVFISRYITTADNRPGWRGPILLGWAGMRGVVSLAAALSIPLQLKSGAPFPQRNLILFITFVVILVTLVVQGLTFPALIRLVNMPDPDHHASPEEQHRQIRQQLAAATIQFLESHPDDLARSNSLLQQLKTKLQQEEAFMEHCDNTHELGIFGKVYLEALDHQRHLLHQINKNPTIDEDIIREQHILLDLEEEKVRSRYVIEPE
ncbi:Na+/H+ antiporter [Deminuibacter soli]|uniref:Na+/H+ antiporter n=1 Tax=Deminuibacter soli TaxID=2291815 RepID=A0A3E1NIY8_9BACT|nr:Na+/H+ antiporter [Deminuibacter soli]RFM27899.1 Na+/H+ antiporter [Deminuibacter soli]